MSNFWFGIRAFRDDFLNRAGLVGTSRQLGGDYSRGGQIVGANALLGW
jgi:hypothetical protein